MTSPIQLSLPLEGVVVAVEEIVAVEVKEVVKIAEVKQAEVKAEEMVEIVDHVNHRVPSIHKRWRAAATSITSTDQKLGHVLTGTTVR